MIGAPDALGGLVEDGPPQLQPGTGSAAAVDRGRGSTLARWDTVMMLRSARLAHLAHLAARGHRHGASHANLVL